MRALFLSVAVVVLAFPATAGAQRDEDDPLSTSGVDDLGRLPVGRPPPAAAGRRDADLPVTVHDGEIVDTISGVRETSHRVDVELAHGLARADVEMRFASTARWAGEVRYRLAVPGDAALASLEVCTVREGAAPRCREGLPNGAALEATYAEALRASGSREAPPVALAKPLRDARGAAIDVRAAPVRRGEDLIVRVAWIARAPMRGGVVRLTLPPRGSDPRAAQSVVSVSADGLLAAAAAGSATESAPVQLDSWVPIELTATAPTGTGPGVTAWRFACGDRICARVRASAGPRPGRPVDMMLLIDASPSMEGPARGRVGSAIAAVLGSAPSGSRVRALAFAGRAETLIDRAVEAADAPLVPLARAPDAQLGSATRFEAAWPAVRGWLDAPAARGLEPLVVIVGDGGLTRSSAGDAAFAALARRRVPLVVVNLADRATAEPLAEAARASGGIAIDAGAEADLAARGHATGPLDERIAPAFAPILAPARRVRANGADATLPPLRAGEEIVWEGAVARGALASVARGMRARWSTPPATLAATAVHLSRTLGIDDPRAALAAIAPDDARAPAPARCDAPPRERLESAVSATEAPVAPAVARCAPPAAAVATTARRTGVPAETVRRMVRDRVVPIARSCFRRDRAGRGDYEVRAELRFRLADREVASAEVRGEITGVLRACLDEALDALEVPPFDGLIDVRYPLRTERFPPPPTIELLPSVATEVDRVIAE